MDQTSRNRQIRQNLRQATLILPRTGERVKRVFTLRTPTRENSDPLARPSNVTANESDAEDAPLLRRRPRSALTRTNSSRSGLRWPGQKNYVKIVGRRARQATARAYAFATSKTGINILKCGVTYLAGSMGTFADPLAEWLGRHNDGKHMIATCAVYFHPGRTMGSMMEATFVAIVAFLYAAIVSFVSMAISIVFNRRGLLQLGHAIVLILCCGGGLGFVGWTKQKLGNPLVNVACSLTSLALITVLTKEGAPQSGTFSYVKVLQVLKMVILAILFSSFVNVAIKPTFARNELNANIIRTTGVLGEMLTTITRSFLSGTESDLLDPAFKSASSKAKAAFGTLAKQLKEARNEHYALGTEDEYKIEARLVKILEEMSQSIGGLRSAAATQFALIKEPPGAGVATPTTPRSMLSPSASFVGSPTEQQSLDIDAVRDGIGGLASIDEAPEDASILSDDRDERREMHHARRPSGPPKALGTSTTPDDIFAIFIAHLGPPMKSLAFTLKGVLDELPAGHDPSRSHEIGSQLRSSLADAIDLFSKARKEGLQILYQTKIMARSGRSTEIAVDFEEVAASCGYFSSSLQDFAEDMLSYLDMLEELRLELNKGQRRRSWKWMMFWRRNRKNHDPNVIDSPPNPHASLEDSTERGANGSRTPLATLRASMPKPVKAKPLTGHKTWVQRIYVMTLGLRREDTKYAVKVGLGAMLWAMWSYIPVTRPYYGLWRGEWGLLSYMLVCSMTIGASNTTGWQRFSGTCLGAVFTVIAWLVSHGNVFALAFLGWLVSSGCFYIIVGQGRGPMGRFIMLTYNLSCLYAYSLTVDGDDGDEDEGGSDPNIWEIVMHRVVAVTLGCLWGIIITRVIWPISARDKLQQGMSLLWLRMALIWKRDPLAILMEPKDTDLQRPVTRGTTGIKVSSGGPASAYMDIRESLELRRFLRYLEGLRKSAQSEFQLKGPFRDSEYGAILAATDRILDAFYAMNVVIAKDLKSSSGEAALLRYTVKERTALSKRISHLFSVMASSMHMAYPLNDALPPIEHSRDRLLARIFEFRKEQNAQGQEKVADEDFELLYAYALVTGQIAKEIETMGADIEKLYGVLNEEDLRLQ